MIKPRGSLLVFVAFCVAITAVALSAQEKARTVWDGIYTDAQATRGEATYRESCTSCHKANLEGSGNFPPLVGKDFTTNWNGMSVGLLFEKMQSSMPADRPGQLSEAQNADILAYLLKMNKFPAGSAELPADADSLKKILFTAAK